MQLSFLVAKALLEGDFASYLASLPSADVDPESIVLREGRFERTARLEAEERGTVTVAVMVMREVAASAEADAQACERWIRTYGWEPVAENGSWRIAGLDTTAPAFKEIDGSGHFVWAFDIVLTVVRSLCGLADVADVADMADVATPFCTDLREDQARLPEPDGRHIAERRVRPADVVPAYPVEELRPEPLTSSLCTITTGRALLA